MNRKSVRSASLPIEFLESRTMLSAAAPTTTTTIRASTGTAEVGQNVTFTVAVKGSKHSGKISGAVEFLDNGSPIVAGGNTLTVALKNGKASYRFGPGDAAFFNGTHQITAEFLSRSKLPDSTSTAVPVTVTVPTLTTAADGLETATFGKGHGKPIKTGQTARVLYTGFLASDGTIFDYATAHKPAYFKFKLGAAQSIQGFDEGTVGMQVGQSRVLGIPPALGYGANGSPPTIPANAFLVFLITLLKVSKK